MATDYTPHSSLNAETQAAYRRFHKKTGIVPAPCWWPDAVREAREQWEDDPARLSDAHIAAIACIFPDDAEQAYEAREKARHPVASQVSTSSNLTAQLPKTSPAPRAQRALVTVTREQAEAMLEIAIKNTGAVRYDSKEVAQAAERYVRKPQEITDRDIALFSIFDRDLARRACARRAGHNWWRADSAEREKALQQPVTHESFLRWRADVYGLHQAMSRYRLQDTIKRVEWLETQVDTVRIKALEASGSGDGHLARASEIEELKQQLRDLAAQIAEVKEFRWCDVWSPETTYRKGNFVTWGGSMWHCESAISRGEKPGTPAAPSRSWKLCVQRGKDGRNGGAS